MGRIYRQASSVVAWLGEPTDTDMKWALSWLMARVEKKKTQPTSGILVGFEFGQPALETMQLQEISSTVPCLQPAVRPVHAALLAAHVDLPGIHRAHY